MGAFLGTPKKEKASDFGGSKASMTSQFGVASMQGWRQSMEDAHIAVPSIRSFVEKNKSDVSSEYVEALTTLSGMDIEDLAFYGVFDGHGSSVVSKWTAQNFVQVFSRRLCSIRAQVKDGALPQDATRAGNDIDADLISFTSAVLCQAIQETFLDIDECLQQPEIREQLHAYHEESLMESEGSETYLQHLLSTGCNLQLAWVDGQRYLQLVVKNDSDGDEGNPSTKGVPDRLMDDPSKSVEVIEGTENNKAEPDAEAKKMDGCKRLTRLNSTNLADPGLEEECTSEVNATVTDNTSVRKDDATSSGEIISRRGDPGGSAQEVREADGDGAIATDEEAEKETACGKDQPSDSKACEKLDGFKLMMVPSPGDENMEKVVDDEPVHPEPYSPEGSGATAVVALVVGGSNPVLVVANAGDSRCVICRGGVAYPLSHDHKPTNVDEMARITAARGTVSNGRVDGNLNLSRSLGDLFYKGDKDIPAEAQRITAFPDVRVTRICEDDEFVVVACDGIWDCKSNQEAIDFVRDRLKNRPDVDGSVLRDICEELCDDCLSVDPIQSEGHGCDNMTVVIFEISSALRSANKSNDPKVVLYGGGEDKFLGQNESDYDQVIDGKTD